MGLLPAGAELPLVAGGTSACGGWSLFVMGRAGMVWVGLQWQDPLEEVGAGPLEAHWTHLCKDGSQPLETQRALKAGWAESRTKRQSKALQSGREQG